MRSLNRDWRGITTSTGILYTLYGYCNTFEFWSSDILSAPLNDFLEPEVFSDEALLTGEKHLGDIAISPAYVKRQCLRDLEDFNVI